MRRMTRRAISGRSYVTVQALGRQSGSAGAIVFVDKPLPSRDPYSTRATAAGVYKRELVARAAAAAISSAAAAAAAGDTHASVGSVAPPPPTRETHALFRLGQHRVLVRSRARISDESSG